MSKRGRPATGHRRGGGGVREQTRHRAAGGEKSDEGDEEQIAWGGICLGTDGCGMYWHLIVTGPERGMPWMLAGEGIQPLCPKRPFLQWYEDRLDGKDSF
jgi:hypothetical protein